MQTHYLTKFQIKTGWSWFDVTCFIIHRESFILLFQGHELLRLGAWYWWRAPNGWDTTGRPQVFGRSVGEPINPIFIGSIRRSYLHPQIRIEIWMGRRIVPISLPQPAIILLFQDHELLKLGARYWWRAPNSWDTTGRPQVFGRSVGEPVDLIFIGSTRRSYLYP